MGRSILAGCIHVKPIRPENRRARALRMIAPGGDAAPGRGVGRAAPPSAAALAEVGCEASTGRLAKGRRAGFRGPTRPPPGGAWAFALRSGSGRGAGMDTERIYERYRELQAYVGWGDDDERRVAAI